MPSHRPPLVYRPGTLPRRRRADGWTQRCRGPGPIRSAVRPFSVSLPTPGFVEPPTVGRGRGVRRTCTRPSPVPTGPTGDGVGGVRARSSDGPHTGTASAVQLRPVSTKILGRSSVLKGVRLPLPHRVVHGSLRYNPGYDPGPGSIPLDPPRTGTPRSTCLCVPSPQTLVPPTRHESRGRVERGRTVVGPEDSSTQGRQPV